MRQLLRASTTFVLAAFALGGCGDAVAKPKPADALAENLAHPGGKRPIAETPVAIVQGHRGMTGGVGALERPAALRRFYEALARLESGQAQDDVRIVQFGDSHTAADVETAVVRRSLQARFGDGGRGFVAIGRPWKRYIQEGVRVGMSNEWSPEKGKLERGKLTGDGMYGLAGISVLTRQHGARAWSDITAKTTRAELSYLEQPGGGSFDVIVDGVRVVRIASRGEKSVSAFRTFDVAETAAHQVEVRASGDGDVRVFGVSLDRAQHGVVLDALGINGARISTALSWNEQHFSEQLRHRAPQLVVLAYGTNESTDESMPAATYERHLVDALGRVARAVPSASCLLLGPPDRAVPGETKDSWVTSQKLVEIIASQKRVAEAAGCAFYDQLAAMGGQGTVAMWSLEDPPRAQKDRVHLTRDGYALLGAAFSADIQRGYASWRREQNLAPSIGHVEPPPAASTLPQPAPAPDVDL